ncbi:MAG: alkaline phosphatase family protein, partial [Candidatus Obscuribacterales bacterium]|nr:alkaline phosphatase family protein [Candidatus Obscuribacterales bacterium]
MTASKSSRPVPDSSHQISRARIFASCLFLTMFLISQVILSPHARAQADQSTRPSLVIMLVADQFSYNFLARYDERLTTGGLKFLTEQGAQFGNCRFDCAVTDASVGHSVLSTGAYPWQTGVIANKWYDRRSRCDIRPTDDKNASMVGANGTAGSVKLMTGTTIGDQLKLASNGRSKVLSLAVNESAGLLLAGRLASNVFWFDTKSGNMVSSSKYGSTQPAWAKAFNDQHYADRYIGKPWQRLMPETQYGASTRDDYPRERVLDNDGRSFPHVVNRGSGAEGQDYYGSFAMTPWANQLVCDFARDAIEKEHLGSHNDPDLLIIS